MDLQVREHSVPLVADITQGLVMDDYNRSQYVSHHFQVEAPFLAVESSPSFVRASERNLYWLLQCHGYQTPRRCVVSTPCTTWQH